MGHTCYRQDEKYKESIRKRDNYTCQICGAEGWQVDHIIPFAISHDSSPSNLRVVCRKCNIATRRPRKDKRLPLSEYYAWIETELAGYGRL